MQYHNPMLCAFLDFRPLGIAKLVRNTRIGAMFAELEVMAGAGDSGLDVGDERVNRSRLLAFAELAMSDDDRAMRGELGAGCAEAGAGIGHDMCPRV